MRVQHGGKIAFSTHGVSTSRSLHYTQQCSYKAYLALYIYATLCDLIVHMIVEIPLKM